MIIVLSDKDVSVLLGVIGEEDNLSIVYCETELAKQLKRISWMTGKAL